MIEKEVIANTEEGTRNFIASIINDIKRGTIILLRGDLGVGKTFFTQILINSLLEKENKKNIPITSPTFNIVKTYELEKFIIYHFDLYRIKHEEELFELDLENAFENVSIIEWPEIAENILPYKTFDIDIKVVDNIRKYIVKIYN